MCQRESIIIMLHLPRKLNTNETVHTVICQRDVRMLVSVHKLLSETSGSQTFSTDFTTRRSFFFFLSACRSNLLIVYTLLDLFVDSLLSVDDDLSELEVTLLGDGWLLDCSSLVGEPVSLLWPLLKDDSCFKKKHTHRNSWGLDFWTMVSYKLTSSYMKQNPSWISGQWSVRAGLTGALLRRVLMPCLLFITSSSFTGLNMNEAPGDFGAWGRQPCLFSCKRQVEQSRWWLSLPPWCQSLEPVRRKWFEGSSLSKRLIEFPCETIARDQTVTQGRWRTDLYSLVAPQLLQDLISCSLSSLSRSSSLAELASTATQSTFLRSQHNSLHVKTLKSAHLNNYVTLCLPKLPQSESWPYARTALCAAVDKLSFLQPREFSSSGNRKRSALPEI